MGWKNWPYWLRGGIISLIFSILLYFVASSRSIVEILGGQRSIFPGIIIAPIFIISILSTQLLLPYFQVPCKNIFPCLSDTGDLLAKILFFIILFITFFLAGAIIGLIVGKIKSKKNISASTLKSV